MVALPSRPSWNAEGRTWSGRLAVPLMPWHGSFSSLGVSYSLASVHKMRKCFVDMKILECMNISLAYEKRHVTYLLQDLRNTICFRSCLR